MLLPLTFNFKSDFSHTFSKWDSEQQRTFCFQVLSEITVAILNDDDMYLHNLNWVTKMLIREHGDILRKSYQSDKNTLKETNLVVLATRHGSKNSLEYLSSRGRDGLLSFARECSGEAIRPEDVDQDKHTPFYYAMKHRDVYFVKMACERMWSDLSSDQLDEQLSRAYHELKLRNVQLSREVEEYVVGKLVDLRFFSKGHKRPGEENQLESIVGRVDFLLQAIDHFVKNIACEEGVDHELVVVGERIAKNLHTLKYQLKRTYDAIPWEEMEFCLVVFIKKFKRPHKTDLFYCSVLRSDRMTFHLKHFADALESQLQYIKRSSVEVLRKYPLKKRPDIIADIKSRCRPFEDLYDDYKRVRYFYSLELMKTHADLVSGTEWSPGGHLVVMRALQVVGECLKKSIESPKLSQDTAEYLLNGLQKDSRNILEQLRNSLSKDKSLMLREQIAGYGEPFFQMIKEDISKLNSEITRSILWRKKEVSGDLVAKLVRCKSVGEVKRLFDTLHVPVEALRGKKEAEDSAKKILQKRLSEKLELVSELRSLVLPGIADENFRSIASAIANEMKVDTKRLQSYFDDLEQIHTIVLLMEKKFLTDSYLEYLQTNLKRLTEVSLKEVNLTKNSKDTIISGLAKIFQSVRPYVPVQDFNKVEDLHLKLLNALSNNSNEIRWLKELKNTLAASKEQPFIDQDQELLMKTKLEALRTVFDDNNLFQTAEPYIGDSRLRSEVDMLVLDVMSMLSNSHFSHNQFFLDSVSPMAIGKNLRNHLAHGNVLYDELLTEQPIQILSNARKLLNAVDYSRRPLFKIDLVHPCSVPALERDHLRDVEMVRSQRSLFEAARMGDVKGIASAIAKGADIDGRTLKQSTCLHMAASGGHYEACRLLCSLKANPLARDMEGQTSLHAASEDGDRGWEVIPYLVAEYHIPVDVADDDGRSPLHVAAEAGRVEAVRVLLELDAKTDSVTRVGSYTPAHLAVLNAHMEVLKVLLDYGAIDEEAGGGLTLLHLAADRDSDAEMVGLVLDGKPFLDARDDLCRTPLHLAASRGNCEVIRSLVRSGADVNATSIHGMTPLHYAADKKQSSAVQTLLDLGADPDAAPETSLQDSGYPHIEEYFEKRTLNKTILNLRIRPLMMAAGSGCTKCVRALLNGGATVDAVDRQARTALHVAVYMQREKVVKALLEGGASANEKTNQYTPLHIAAERGNEKIVRILLDARADLNAVDAHGMTPLHLALVNAHNAVARALLKAGAYFEKQKAYALIHNMTDCFIDHGVDLSRLTIGKKTTTHYAVLNDNLPFLSLCVKNNCDVNARDEQGASPLHKAAQLDRLEMIEILLDNGAEIDQEDYSGSRALDLAVIQANSKCVELLIRRGSRVCFQTLTLAVSFDPEVLGLLLPCKNNLHLKELEEGEETLLDKADTKGGIKVPNAKDTKTGDKTNLEEQLPRTVKLDTNASREIGGSLICKDASGLRSKASGLKDTGAEDGNTASKEHLPRTMELDINASKEDGETLLHKAASYGSVRAVEALLNVGADIEAATVKDFARPLHLAAFKGHRDVALVLLSKGADPNAVIWDGSTPLHLAIQGKHTNVMSALLEHGADPFLRHSTLGSCFEVAVIKNDLAALIILQDPTIRNKSLSNRSELIEADGATDKGTGETKPKHSGGKDSEKVSAAGSEKQSKKRGNLKLSCRTPPENGNSVSVLKGSEVGKQNDVLNNKKCKQNLRKRKHPKNESCLLVTNSVNDETLENADKDELLLSSVQQDTFKKNSDILDWETFEVDSLFSSCEKQKHRDVTIDVTAEVGNSDFNLDAKCPLNVTEFEVLTKPETKSTTEENFISKAYPNQSKLKQAQTNSNVEKVENVHLKGLSNCVNEIYVHISKRNSNGLSNLDDGDDIGCVGLESHVDQQMHEHEQAPLHIPMQNSNSVSNSDNEDRGCVGLESLFNHVDQQEPEHEQAPLHLPMQNSISVSNSDNEDIGCVGLESLFDHVDQQEPDNEDMGCVGLESLFNHVDQQAPEHGEQIPIHLSKPKSNSVSNSDNEDMGCVGLESLFNHVDQQVPEHEQAPLHLPMQNSISVSNSDNEDMGCVGLESLFNHVDQQMHEHEEQTPIYLSKPKSNSISNLDQEEINMEIEHLYDQNRVEQKIEKEISEVSPEDRKDVTKISETHFTNHDNQLFSKEDTYYTSSNRNNLSSTSENSNVRKCDSNEQGFLLHIAAEEGHLEMVRHLVRGGANVLGVNSEGFQPHHIACLNGHSDVVSFLLEKMRNFRKVFNSLLHLAAFGGHCDTLELLLKEGASVNEKDINGETALHFAAREGHDSAVRKLLKHGAQFDVRNNDGRTPLQESIPSTYAILKPTMSLFAAVEKNDFIQVKRSVKEGAILNVKCSRNMTPLLWAAERCPKDVVDFLLSRGADPNLSGPEKRSPLHLASLRKEGGPTVRSLLSYGAIYDIPSEDGKTPLQLANSSSGRLLDIVYKVFGWLRQGPSFEDSVITCLKTLTDFQDRKAVVRAKDKDRRTLVAVAFLNRFAKIGEMRSVLMPELNLLDLANLALLWEVNHKDIIRLNRKLLETSLCLFCPENPFVQTVRFGNAQAHIASGDVTKGASILSSVSEVCDRTLGPANQLSCQVKAHLELVLQDQRKGRLTLRMVEEMSSKKKASVENVDELVKTELYLEMMRVTLDPNENSLASLERAHEKFKRISGMKTNVLNAHVLNVLGNAYVILNRRQESVMELFSESYALLRDIMGEDHPDTMAALGMVGDAFGLQNKWDRARRCYERQLKSLVGSYGRDHFLVVPTLHKIGKALVEKQKIMGALLVFKEQLALKKDGNDAETSKALEIVGNIQRYYMYKHEPDQLFLRELDNLFLDR